MIKERLQKIQKNVDYKIAQRDVYIKQKNGFETSLSAHEQSLKIKGMVRSLFELFVKGTEYRLREYVEPIINEGLKYVFEQDLFFHMYFSARRNQVEIDFLILRTKEWEEQYQVLIKATMANTEKSAALKLANLAKESSDINDSFGGAVNQVLSVLLRIVIVELLKVEGPLCFDEPTSMISEVYAGRLGKLLDSLSRKYGRQYIFITHSHTLAACADLLYQVDLTDGISKVTEKEIL